MQFNAALVEPIMQTAVMVMVHGSAGLKLGGAVAEHSKCHDRMHLVEPLAPPSRC